MEFSPPEFGLEGRGCSFRAAKGRRNPWGGIYGNLGARQFHRLPFLPPPLRLGVAEFAEFRRLWWLQDFIVAEFIKGDKPVRPADDLPRGTVIQFQAHDFGLGPIVFKAEDVGQFRPAPAVYRLIVVAHHANVSMLFSQGFYNPILSAVGILIFIHQEMIEAVGLGLADFGKLGKQIFGANQQVVEIQCPGRFSRHFWYRR